jgi:hypothetical protein
LVTVHRSNRVMRSARHRRCGGATPHADSKEALTRGRPARTALARRSTSCRVPSSRTSRTSRSGARGRPGCPVESDGANVVFALSDCTNGQHAGVDGGGKRAAVLKETSCASP